MPSRWRGASQGGLRSSLSGTVVVLAREAGMTVVCAGRTRSKLDAAVAALRASYPRAALVPMVVDVASFASVRAFVGEFEEQFPEAAGGGPKTNQLALLINNAGIMAGPYAQSADGLELQACRRRAMSFRACRRADVFFVRIVVHCLFSYESRRDMFGGPPGVQRVRAATAAADGDQPPRPLPPHVPARAAPAPRRGRRGRRRARRKRGEHGARASQAARLGAAAAEPAVRRARGRAVLRVRQRGKRAGTQPKHIGIDSC